jgi:hypothetical protein
LHCVLTDLAWLVGAVPSVGNRSISVILSPAGADIFTSVPRPKRLWAEAYLLTAGELFYCDFLSFLSSIVSTAAG